MRLIDADEVKRFYKEEFPDLDNRVHWSRNDIIMNLDNIPTVKAIPIEWLKSWAMKNWVKSKKCEFDIIVSKLIDDWTEKENETD